MKTFLHFLLLTLLISMFGFGEATAQEAYAQYDGSGTLTFYYDNLRSQCSGTTYDMNGHRLGYYPWNEGAHPNYVYSAYSFNPGWVVDGTNENVTRVVFDTTFKDARPKATGYWFYNMTKLRTITGMKENLNTSDAECMDYMFSGCSLLTAIDVSSFETSNVKSFAGMFDGCSSLESIDVSGFIFKFLGIAQAKYKHSEGVDNYHYYFIVTYQDGLDGMFQNCSALKTIYDRDREYWDSIYYVDWDDGVTDELCLPWGRNMFTGCTSLVGGAGTTYDDNNTGYAYAHIDGGSDNPGYLTIKLTIDQEHFPDAAFRNYLLAQDYGKDGLLTNEEIKAIKSLNVSSQNIKSLKGIEFFYALTTLTCRFNQLTNLDVSKNAALTGLYCSSNPLTALDVSKNTALESLECDNNQLTALDVSNNTALTSLHCVNNQLTALDVSKNTALTSLSCFNNDLTALDVSNNKALTGLYCHQNQIKGDRMEALVASLPKNTTNDIHYFYVNYNTSDEGNVITEEQVAAAKVKGWTVYWYNGKDWEPYEVSYAINEKNFPDAAFRNYLLAQDYGKDGKITEDEIQTVNWINVEEKGIKTLKGVEFFTALTSLYCSDNQLTELDLSMNTKLSTLWCQRNQLIKLDVSNTALTQLQCYMNQLKGKNMDAFIAGLPINTDEEFPYYLFVYKKSPNEGNVMTKAQVAAATARGWEVMMYWENGDMDLYEGIDVMGDVNGDGTADVADIACIIDVMAGKALEYKDKADVNKDKTVDVADIAIIIDIMAGKDVDIPQELRAANNLQ